MGWLITLAILALLAILPLGATALYRAEGFSLKLIAGPLRIGLIPGKKKEKKPKKQEKKKTKVKKETTPGHKPQTQEKKGGSWTDFLPLVRVGLDLLNDFRRKLRIDRLEVKLIMASGDPCDLAINYGRANAALGNLWPMLERCFVIKKRDVEIECDFEASETVIYARADLTITLGRLLVLVVRYGIRALKTYLNIQKSRKGGASK